MNARRVTAELPDLFGLPVFGVFRGLDPASTVQLCRAAWELGVETVEIPVETPAALDSLRAAVHAGREQDRPVGAGTVVDVEQVDTVSALGAAFTVAPGYSREVAERSRAHGLPHVPGVATATEVMAATAHGLRWLKVFPAAALGTAWLRAQRGPFPGVSFLATGGVRSSNAAGLIEAGAWAVGMGSDLATIDGAAAATRLLRERRSDRSSGS